MERTYAKVNRSRRLFISARHKEEDCIRHLHPALEIVLVTDGTLTMEVGRQRYTISAGYGIFVPPFETHLFASSPGNRYHVLEFSGELVPYFLHYIGRHEVTRHIFAVPATCASLAEAMPDCMDDGDLVAAQGVLAPLCHAIRELCGFRPCEGRKGDTCRLAVSYMCLHFTEGLTLAAVARAVGVHPVTLSKLFVSHLGLHFHEYLQYLRVSHAMGLIRSGGGSIAEIAYASGFGSIRSFNRAFLATHGKRPHECRTEREGSASPL